MSLTTAARPAPTATSTPATSTPARPRTGRPRARTTPPRVRLGVAGRGQHEGAQADGRVRTGRTTAAGGGASALGADVSALPVVRLTRRGLLATRLVAVATLLLIGFGFAQGAVPARPASVGTQVVTVLPGESLWSVAQQVNPTADPRVTIEAIRELNDLGSGASVRSGSELMVPVFGNAR